MTTGSRTLKDAINEAFRDWVTNVETTHYVFGTVAGPHPFPAMVRDFQRVIGVEAREQVLEREGRLPDAVLRLRRRRLQRDRHLPPRSSPTTASRWSASRPAATASTPGGTRPRSPAARRRAARRPHLPAAGRERADHRVALDLRRPGLPRRRPGARVPARHRPRRVRAGHRRRGDGGVRAALPDRGHHPGDRDGARPGRRAWCSASELGPDATAAGEPVRPRRQGRRDRRARGSASATARRSTRPGLDERPASHRGRVSTTRPSRARTRGSA